MNFDWVQDLIAKLAVPIVLVIVGIPIWKAMTGGWWKGGGGGGNSNNGGGDDE